MKIGMFNTEKIINESGSGSVTFLVGKNGSGKSRCLGQITTELYLSRNNNIIAISNSAISKFPSKNNYRLGNYKLFNPASIIYKPSEIVKKIARDSYRENFKNLFIIREIFEDVGLSSTIGFSIVRNLRPYDPLRDRETVHLIDLINEIKSSASQTYDRDITPGINYLEKIANTPRNIIEFIDINEIKYSSISNILLSLILLEKKLLPHFKLAIWVKKSEHRNSESEYFSINQISSGERSRFSINSFIALNSVPGSYLLIDEPENSLHPEWQSNYCKKILDLFFRQEFKIIIATHSPMVVSGAISEGISVNIFSPDNDTPTRKIVNNSIDALLMEAFETVSPKNHYLSEKANHLLKRLQESKINLNYALQEISNWKSNSYDEKQKNFLENLSELARKI